MGTRSTGCGVRNPRTTIDLSGLKFGELFHDGRQFSTKIRNGKGNYVGKFVTTGVGLNEHRRRIRALVKRTVKGTVKCGKGQQ